MQESVPLPVKGRAFCYNHRSRVFTKESQGNESMEKSQKIRYQNQTELNSERVA
jgi:hypothetical protein